MKIKKAIFLFGIVASITVLSFAGQTRLTKNQDETVTKEIIYEKSEVQAKLAELRQQKQFLQDEKDSIIASLNAKISILNDEINELKATVE